jgi:hypothetical protein
MTNTIGNHMTCDNCGRADGIDFLVSTKTWNRVMMQTDFTNVEGLSDIEGVGGVLCLSCFDALAAALGVEYRDEVVVFGRFAWMAGTYTGGMPENPR